jgi:hypothetical protein
MNHRRRRLKLMPAAPLRTALALSAFGSSEGESLTLGHIALGAQH